MKNKLDSFRKQIDEIDGLIVKLLTKRMNIVEKVGI